MALIVLNRSMRCLAAFLMLVASHVFAQQMVSVSGEDVKLRSGPGTQHPVDWILGRGFPLKVVGQRGDWLEVRDFENDKGWIYRQLTSSTPYHIVKVKVANMRSQPTTSSRIIGKFVKGGKVLGVVSRGDFKGLEFTRHEDERGSVLWARLPSESGCAPNQT